MDWEGLGDLRYLPDDELRMILKNLKFVDIGNMRCASKRLKKHVTNLSKAFFKTFHIKEINETDCEDISRILAIAMNGDQAPEKLELAFDDDLTPVMRQMLLDYIQLVSSLTIKVTEHNTEFLLQQSTYFESLESLKLCCDILNVKNSGAVCEDMIAKHAHNLTHLEVEYLEENFNVPVLPVIDCLVLRDVDDEAACSLLEQSRNTMTSFTIFGTNIILSNSAAYKIQNLKHLCLTMNSRNAFKFVLRNSNNLVSLDLSHSSNIPENIRWPEFSSLRELNIGYYERLLPIISKSKNTLEKLIIYSIPSADHEYAVEIQGLTDLYMTRVNHEFVNKILMFNCKSLEFLYLDKIAISFLDYETLRMCKMKKVMLGLFDASHSEVESAHMKVMCPNAEIVVCEAENLMEVRDDARGRSKRKRFTIDPERFISF